jgi:hypothetical protein
MVDKKILSRFERPEETHPYQKAPAASVPGRREKLLRQDVAKDKAVSNLTKLKTFYLDQCRKALIRAWGRARLRQEELRAALDAMLRWHDEAVAGVLSLRDREAQIEAGWNTLTAGANNAGFRDWVPSRLTSRGSGNKLEKAETLDALHDEKTLQWQTKKDKAILLWQMSQPKRAVQILKQVLQDAKIAEDRLWQALALFSLGELAFDSVNGVEWGLSCMEEALALGEAVLGSERYHAFNERKIQLQDEQSHSTRPLKHASQATQSLGWKYSPAQQTPSESGTTF